MRLVGTSDQPFHAGYVRDDRPPLHRLRSYRSEKLHCFGGTQSDEWIGTYAEFCRCCSMIEFNFTPELHLRDGRVIRHLQDALNFAREQEARPGVDQRDEVLHNIERAQTVEEAHAAAHQFLRWLEEIELLI